MRDRFRLTPGGRQPHEPWFHIGSLGVTTTWFVVLLSIVGLLYFAIGGTAGVNSTLVLDHDSLTGLRLWTFLTWPFAYPDMSIFALLSIAFFWYFGTEIERELLGRVRFAWLVVCFAMAIAVLTIVLGELLASPYIMAGLGGIEIMVLLLYIAEWPDRRFFFNIPAWLVGLVIIGIELIQYLGYRSWVELIAFLLGIVVCAFISRQFGLLDRYPWIPRLVGPHPPRAARMPSLRKQRKQQRTSQAEGGNVVAGPWASTPQPPQSRDEQRMDELLDKIHATGTESLTDSERAELLELRERRRKRS